MPLNKFQAVSRRAIVGVVLTLAIGVATTAAAKESVLYAFTGSSDGAFPDSGLVFDDAGNLYGTNQGGKVGGIYGNVFELTPSASGWTETVIHAFADPSDGINPVGPLVRDDKGNLFGATVQGGGSNAGTVFELSPTSDGGWTKSTIYVFSGGSDGAYPSGVISDGRGNIYGTTDNGGDTSCSCGVVFELMHSKGSWTEIVLHSFLGIPDGKVPVGLVFDNVVGLYGTTEGGGLYGGGTVFQLAHLNHRWKESILHSFTGGADGYLPVAGVIVDQAGDLYGTTNEGGGDGCQNGCGVVFELKRISNEKWKEVVLHRFKDNGHDGTYPTATLIFDGKGNLYGTTYEGGAYGNGTAFELLESFDGSWVETVIETFISPSRGSQPNSLILGTDGNLYGSAYDGGAYGDGLAFQLSP
jgi:uncharacterized repeat protein (TIGR03803 family)